MLETMPGPDSGEIETAISYILSGVLDIADSASVSMNGHIISVEVTNPKLVYEDVWYYRCIGSPVASIAAAISTEAVGRPVRIAEENADRGKSRIVLEVLDENI